MLTNDFIWGRKVLSNTVQELAYGAAYSSNSNRWWVNQIFPSLTYGMSLGPITKSLGQWDASRLEVYVGSRKFFGDTPRGYGGLETGVRALFIFGGDHMKK